MSLTEHLRINRTPPTTQKQANSLLRIAAGLEQQAAEDEAFFGPESRSAAVKRELAEINRARATSFDPNPQPEGDA